MGSPIKGVLTHMPYPGHLHMAAERNVWAARARRPQRASLEVATPWSLWASPFALWPLLARGEDSGESGGRVEALLARPPWGPSVSSREGL